MQELIQQLVDKAGLTPDQAEKSLAVIKEYIQSQLPPMMQGMVDNFLGQQDTGDRIGE
jgi:nucleoid DNA-binding protein